MRGLRYLAWVVTDEQHGVGGGRGSEARDGDRNRQCEVREYVTFRAHRNRERMRALVFTEGPRVAVLVVTVLCASEGSCADPLRQGGPDIRRELPPCRRRRYRETESGAR